MTGKYLFFQWAAYGKSFLEAEFELLGFTTVSVGVFNKNVSDWTKEEEENALAALRNELHKGGFLFVYSFNYLDVVSILCHEFGICYISWTYDSPWDLLKADSVAFDTSHIFVFDSHLLEQAQAHGAKNAHYLPLASHPQYYDALESPTPAMPTADVSFVGRLYDNGEDMARLLSHADSHYLNGYMDGLISAQDNVYNTNLMRYGLNDSIDALLDEMAVQKKFHFIDKLGLSSQAMGSYVLFVALRAASHRMRVKICTKLARSYDFLLYTSADMAQYPDIKVHKAVNTYLEAPFAYRNAKINLNPTIFTIYHGIPFRCFEIMASGGFLLSNHQKDFDEHFLEGVHYAAYSTMEELTDKIDFYLRNDTLRKRIAQNGYEEIVNHHTTARRAKQMLTVSGIL